MSADLRLSNARIPGRPGLFDITITDGRVAHFDQSGDAHTGRNGQLDSIDVAGGYVLPGLWDEHVHFTQWTLKSQWLDLAPARSAADAADLVRARAELAEPGTVIIGQGFQDGLWMDQPTAAMLDEAGEGAAVALISHDIHCVWLSSAAAALFDAHVDVTGLLREQAAFDVNRKLANVPAELLDPWAGATATQAASRGVVGIVDFEMAWSRDIWSRRVAHGIRNLRVEFGIYPEHLDQAIDDGLRTGDVIDETDGLISVGFHKVLIDGSLNTRTAYCFDHFPELVGQPNSFGLLTVQPADLVARLRRSASAGITAAVHAIGDHAVRIALDAFEEAGVGGRIEHAQLIAAEDLPRFGELGVVASLQPEHAMDDRDVADHHWAGRTDRAFPLRSLLDAGATIALGSDAPVAPLDPWITIAAAVSRSRDNRSPWHPEQVISAREAFAGAARGRTEVAVGDIADLVVTELDPFTATAEQLRTMPVALTLLEGRVTWASPKPPGIGSHLR